MTRPIIAFTFLCVPLGSILAADSSTVVASSVTVPPGTPVRLRLGTNLSSRDAQVADRVEFRVEEDVDIGGVKAIPKGSLAWGNVSEASPRGRMARSGRLSVNIRAVCLADGGSATLRGADPNRAALANRRNKPDDAGDNALAIPAWPILIFMMGKDVNVPAGTGVTAYIDAPVRIDPARVRQTPANNCDNDTQAAGAAAQDGAVANIRSNPDGAEIDVDGKYAGNTPSRLRLRPGEHRVALVMHGRESWERSVTVESGGELTIFASLDPAKPITGSRDGGN